MRRPHVLHVVLSLHPGGTERLVIDLVTRLAADVDASVCCLDEAGAWASQLTERGVAVIPLHRAPGFQPLLGRRLAAVAVQQRATVLHCHHYSPFIYGRLAALGWRTLPIVFTEHGRRARSRKRRAVNALAGRLPGTFCAVSEDLKRHMGTEGFPVKHVRVIHNGIDPGPEPGSANRDAARCGLGIAADRYVVGTIARLEPVKDLPLLIDAFARLRAQMPLAELVIVGDGSEKAALARAARDYAISNAVHFTGARSDARRLLPAFDVYVNSSLTEGVSVSILEAMAGGVPVVATRVGGTPEVVLHGSTGLLVPSRDGAALTNALLQLAACLSQAKHFAAEGRRRVATHFTLDRMAESYLELYVRGARRVA